MRNNCLMISLSELKIKYASIKPVAKSTVNTTAIPRASWKIMRCGQEELMVCFTQCIFLEIGSALFFIYTHYIKITKLRYINSLFSLIGKKSEIWKLSSEWVPMKNLKKMLKLSMIFCVCKYSKGGNILCTCFCCNLSWKTLPSQERLGNILTVNLRLLQTEWYPSHLHSLRHSMQYAHPVMLTSLNFK